jgi:hypothetical protein
MLALGLAYLPEDRNGLGLIMAAPIADNVTLPVLDRLAKLGFIDLGERGQIESNGQSRYGRVRKLRNGRLKNQKSIPPIAPPPIGIAGASFFGLSPIIASVVVRRPASRTPSSPPVNRPGP